MKKIQEPKQKWSQWVLNLLKQKSTHPPQMTLFWGSTGLARANTTSSTGRKIWILSTAQMSTGFPQILCSKIQPPSSQEILFYGTYYSLQLVLKYLPPWQAVAFGGKKLSLIYPWNWVEVLLHVWWMNTWRRKGLVQYRSDQQLQCPG